MLLYVRVNVKRGEGKQGNGVLASCWQLVVRSSPRPHSHCILPTLFTMLQ